MPDGAFDAIAEAHVRWQERDLEEPLAMAAATSVMRAQQIVATTVDRALRPLDLTFARYEILMLLSFTSAGAMPMTRLGSLLQVHPTSVTSAVDRLQKQGYVERERSATDGRVVLAAITPAGREVAGQATTGLNTRIFEAPGLPAADVAALTALLGAYRTAAGDRVD